MQFMTTFKNRYNTIFAVQCFWGVAVVLSFMERTPTTRTTTIKNPENAGIKTNRNESRDKKKPHELLFLLRRRCDVVETYTTQGGEREYIEYGTRNREYRIKRGEMSFQVDENKM